jgi:hypothetical protein
MASQLQENSARTFIAQSGAEGTKAITGTSAVTPDTGYYFSKLIAVTATVIAAQTAKTGATTATLTGFTSIPAGAVIPCALVSVTLTSGSMLGVESRL